MEEFSFGACRDRARNLIEMANNAEDYASILRYSELAAEWLNVAYLITLGETADEGVSV